MDISEFEATVQRLESGCVETAPWISCPSCSSFTRLKTPPGTSPKTGPFFCFRCGHEGDDAAFTAK